jgi:hypothetical protein
MWIRDIITGSVYIRKLRILSEIVPHMVPEYYVRWIALQLLTVVLLYSPPMCAQARRNDKPTSEASKAEPAGRFDLEAARAYERLSRWKEAEQEYLQAGRLGPPWIEQEAFAAIERLSIHRSADFENFDFELGKLYEDNKEWKEAEQHYAAAAKEAPRPVRQRILLDVERVRGHLWLQEFAEDFTRWLGYLAIVVGLMFAIILIWRVKKTRQGIQIMPFEGSSDDASKRIVFSLSSAREQLPNLLAPVVETMGPNVVDAVPLIILPGVENEFPDPAQDLEIGGVKLPLANWIQFINVPLVRVNGRWNVGQTTGMAQARIQRRRCLATFRDSRSVRSLVDSAATDARDRQLALFGYDVLVKAIYSRRYGP